MVRKKHDSRDQCIVKFCDFVCERHCQPLIRSELVSHYVACREAHARDGLRWPSPADFCYAIANPRSLSSCRPRQAVHLVCSVCSRCLPNHGALKRHTSDREHVECARQLHTNVATGSSTSPAAVFPCPCPLPGCPEQLVDSDQLFQHVSKKAHFLLYVVGSENTPDRDGVNGDEVMLLPLALATASAKYACITCGSMFPARFAVSQHEKTCEYKDVSAREREALARGRDTVDVSFSSDPLLTTEMQPDGAVHVQVQLTSASAQVICTIKNVGNKPVNLYSCSFKITRCKASMSWQDSTLMRPPSGRCSLVVEPGRSYDLKLTASGYTSCGFYPGALQLAFRKTAEDDHIGIVTPVNLHVVTADFELLQPSEPRRSRPPLPTMSSTVLEGMPPEKPTDSRLTFKVPLGKYNIPDDIRDLARSRQSINTARTPLASDNYALKFNKLLYFEELQMEKDIKRYTIRETTMERQGLLLELEVPGLAEKRPSVLRGDSVLVAVLGSDSQPERAESYRGYVHKVELNSVLIRFHESLMMRFMRGMRFMVEFSFNRLPMQLSHRAVEMVGTESMLLDVLFPKPQGALQVASNRLSSLTLSQARFFNQSIERNNEQQRAVKAIVDGVSVPLPYLIFGPPGTGKTVTMVEAIKQVYSQRRDSCILTCAPQNEAADLLAKQLLEHIQQRDVIRLNAASRQKNDISSDKVAAISNYDVEGTVFYPSPEDLLKKRVIICTVVTAGRLVSGGIGRTVFTHIFIDECGHCIEPEAVIPISGLLKVEGGRVVGQLVLAGDPKQLGPVIRSSLASHNGLGLSLLERLMKDQDVYQRSQESGSYNNCVLTKLVKNYRSHQDILQIPNDIFYDNELTVCADLLERTKFCQWSELPSPNFPIIVHGIHGKDEQEGDSPSFFNKDEAVCVVEYAQKVLESRSPAVEPEHIGIIAPY